MQNYTRVSPNLRTNNFPEKGHAPAPSLTSLRPGDLQRGCSAFSIKHKSFRSSFFSLSSGNDDPKTKRNGFNPPVHTGGFFFPFASETGGGIIHKWVTSSGLFINHVSWCQGWTLPLGKVSNYLGAPSYQGPSKRCINLWLWKLCFDFSLINYV